MIKYKGRKTYTEQEAKEQIQMCQMSIETCNECILSFIIKEDKLIQALVNKTRDEIIKENQEKIEFESSKIDYMKQFIV
jgi:hypothetical protein